MIKRMIWLPVAKLEASNMYLNKMRWESRRLDRQFLHMFYLEIFQHTPKPVRILKRVYTRLVSLYDCVLGGPLCANESILSTSKPNHGFDWPPQSVRFVWFAGFVLPPYCNSSDVEATHIHSTEKMIDPTTFKLIHLTSLTDNLTFGRMDP